MTQPHRIGWLNRAGTKGETWNPWVGCTPVSPGCRECYAARMAHRGLCEDHKGLTKIVNGIPHHVSEALAAFEATQNQDAGKE